MFRIFTRDRDGYGCNFEAFFKAVDDGDQQEFNSIQTLLLLWIDLLSVNLQMVLVISTKDTFNLSLPWILWVSYWSSWTGTGLFVMYTATSTRGIIISLYFLLSIISGSSCSGRSLATFRDFGCRWTNGDPWRSGRRARGLGTRCT